jgi:pyruvyltransferase
VRVNWCDKCGHGANFGDQLTSVLLEHFGVPFTWARPARAELVVCGSVLSKFPNGWSGTILGTGFIRAGMRRSFPTARVLAVRGGLTRAILRLPAKTPLGDPGLLVPDLTSVEPGDGVMVLPHYVDHALAKRHPKAMVLDIRTEPRTLIRQIASASLLYTSTLHGLIAADALGIPHVLEPHGEVVGGLFKFQDYASALGERIRPGVKRLSSREAVALAQERLRAAFAKLA